MRQRRPVNAIACTMVAVAVALVSMVASGSRDAAAQASSSAAEKALIMQRLFRVSNIRGLAPRVELAGGAADAGSGFHPFFGARIGFEAATAEVKGGLADLLHLQVVLWQTEVGFYGGIEGTLLDLQQFTFGQKADSSVCVPGFVIFGGDCVADSGGLFLRLLLLRGVKDFRTNHGGAQWAEVGVGFDLAPRRFDVDFFRLRLPLSVGIDISSLYAVGYSSMQWAVSRPYLRFSPTWRSSSLRWEISGEGAGRPRIDAFTRDVHAYGQLRLTWLAYPRVTYNAGNLTRLYLQARYDYHSSPPYALAPTGIDRARHRLLVSVGGDLFFFHTL